MLHQLAWLVVAAGVVVEDRGYTSTSTVYAALDLGPQRYVVAVASISAGVAFSATDTTYRCGPRSSAAYTVLAEV